MNDIQNKFKVRSALVHCEQVHCERISRDYRYNYLSIYRYIGRAIINKFYPFFMIASNKFWDLDRPFLHGRKGASGSWAEPYFACPTLRCGVFAYPPGILSAVFNCLIKENRILDSIPYNWITA